MSGSPYAPKVSSVAAAFLLSFVGLAAWPAGAGAQVALSEIRIDQPSTDVDEYFELSGPSGTSLSGLTYLVIGDSGTAGSGVIEEVTDLAGESIGASGFFVAAESTFTLGTADLTTSLNFENSDNVTHLLVAGFVGSNGQDLDTNDDGVLDVTPWSSIEDCVALIETVGSGDQTYCATGVGPDGSFVPAHAYLCPGGWEIGAFDPAGGQDTPGAANACGPAVGTATLNEIRIDQPGSDLDEYFELAGPAGGTLDGLTYLVIGDGSFDTSGVIEAVVDLTGNALAASGLFVAAESTFTLGTADLTTSLDFENSDNVTHLLVSGFSGSNGDDLDTDDDGTLDVTPWSSIVDCVALVETVGSGNEIYCATTVGPDGSFVPGHAFFCPAGWQIGGFTLGTDDTPGAANVCPVPDPGAALSEIRIDQPGSDLDEYFELTGDPGASLAGLTYLVIGDGAGGSGVVENVTSLAGQTVPGSGFFVAAEASFSLGTADLTTSLNFENSDNVTHLLVRDFTGSNGQDLDTDDDGVLDVTPWSDLVDCVALIESVGSGDQTYCATTVGPDGPFVPGHAYLCPEGWQIGGFSLGSADTPGAANPCGRLVINEIDYDQPGSDTAEFVEIANVGGSPVNLGGVALELVNGTGGGASVYNTIALPAVTLLPGGYFVVCGDAANVAECDLDVTPDSNLIQNGPPDAVAIVAGGSILDTVSYEGDTGAPYTEGSGAGLADSGSSGEDFKGISRFPDGVDTDQNNVDLTNACITPGRANTALAANCTELGPALEIWEIQGSGAATPFAGQTVSTLANAVTAVGLDGFFIQTPAGRTDGDVDTSDGIFVFTGGAPAVAVGDSVDVTGLASEFFNLTEIGGGPTVSVVGAATVPAAVTFDAAVPSPDPTAPSCAIELECYEGMLVKITGGTVTGPNQRFGPDPIAEVHITAAPARAFREPGIQFPGLFGFPVWDGNPEVFELDPDRLGLPNAVIPAGSSFDATGVLGFEFGGYELWPTALSFTPAPLPVPVRAREPGEFTVATLNLFRLFESDPAYATRRAKFASYIVDVLDAPDILVVQEAEKFEVLQALATDIATLDVDLLYDPYLIEGNDVGGIDSGFLVRDTVRVDAVTQLGADEILSFDGSLLHDRPPLLLEGAFLCDCPDGESPIQVMAVHNRSLSGIDTPSAGPRVRQKRLEQAESIAEKVQAIQDADPGARLVVAGDFNAFEFTDGYVHAVGHIQGDFDPGEELVCDTNPCPDLVDPNLANRVLDLAAEERYSFIFRGSAQVLDHALTSEGLDFLVRGAEYGRGNADAAVDLVNDGSTPLRSSDHDGLVLYLMSDCDDDGVADDLDVCPCTVIPEGVPTLSLRVNRWALVTDDTVFDTTLPPGTGPGFAFTTQDTAGCSCEQIIAAQGLGAGHTRYGCSNSAMLRWVDLVN